MHSHWFVHEYRIWWSDSIWLGCARLWSILPLWINFCSRRLCPANDIQFDWWSPKYALNSKWLKHVTDRVIIWPDTERSLRKYWTWGSHCKYSLHCKHYILSWNKTLPNNGIHKCSNWFRLSAVRGRFKFLSFWRLHLKSSACLWVPWNPDTARGQYTWCILLYIRNGLETLLSDTDRKSRLRWDIQHVNSGLN